MQAIAKKEGGFDKLKGKKIALVYHDSPFGKEPIPLLQERAAMHGFNLQLLPVTAPGVEQKATWLQVRQNRPDYVVLWGWGVMNSTALKEAQATGYPREKMYGVWWSGAEPDVKDVAEGAKGYNAVTMQHGAEPQSKLVKDVMALVHGKGQGTGPEEEVGQVLYMRGAMSAMLGVRRRAARARPLWQRQGHDRRASPLGPGKPEPDPAQAGRLGLCRRHAPHQHLMCRPWVRHGRACTPGMAPNGSTALTGWKRTAHHQTFGEAIR